MNEFTYVAFAQEVIFGAGALGKLREAVDRLDARQVMLCTSHSQRASGHAAAVGALLGDRLVATFDQTLPHVQDSQVDDAVALAAAKAVDGVIGLGGGSPLGLAKAVAHALDGQDKPQPRPAPSVPVVAIPTTYAGSEMTAVYGVTHSREKPPRKVTVADARIAPRLVIYDPALTLDLPPALTASTGMNALAHCLEALYSRTRHPLSTAVALSALRYIAEALPLCFADGRDLEARTQLLVGAHLAGRSLADVSMGLHHGLCHVLGGTANVPHGLANSIILPHALRFNAETTAAQLRPAAEVLGVPLDGLGPTETVEAAADRIFHLVGRLGLPQRLRDVGVPEASLPGLAELAFQNRTVHNNPRPVTEAGEIERLLRAAW